MIHLNGCALTASQLTRIARGEGITLDESALARVGENRAVVDRIVAEGRTVYGINTGFGQFATVVIPPEQLQQLQLNLIRSHAAGVGEPLSKEQTRALMAARINCLLKAHSGIRPDSIRLLAECLNRDVIPIVPCQGSVGASGDLAPLAHMALLLVGEGLAWSGGSDSASPASGSTQHALRASGGGSDSASPASGSTQHALRASGGGSDSASPASGSTQQALRASGGVQSIPGGQALAEAGLAPLVLQAKEGLALINGTQLITSLGNLAVDKFNRLAALADLIAALSLEALRGSRRAFDPRIHAARPHPGQIFIAERMRDILGESSAISESHRDCHRVQDAYSLRCIPQVHGVTRDALDFAGAILERELNSATDNPMIFTDTQESRSGGNFHGQYPAFACDVLAIAAADLASISERRQERLVNPAYSDLPAFLTLNGGLESGFMMAQVTSAALVSEMKGLANPACVDTIPTSAGKEDHVSMGPIAARKLLRALDALEQVLAIEARMALEGVRLIGLAPAAGLQPLLDCLSGACEPWVDRAMFEEIHHTLAALRTYEEAHP